ncbi:MAG: hypothetical protein CMP07_10835 [Xanthomonadales bacterium]|nr:hypothetical protein [Xanthomonadales bacterium]
MRRSLRLRFVLALILLPALLVSSQVGAATSEPGAATHEPVVMLSGGQLTDRRLAAFVEIQAGHYLASSALRHACMKLAVRPDSLLLFFPNSQRCEQITQVDTLMLPQRLHAITGRRPPPDLLRRLHDRPFLALAAVPQTQSLRAGDCSCPANTAPEGMVVCQVQTRTTGSRIAPIDYLAADADGDPLSGVFTHQRGIDPIQPGLPAPLTSTCTADPGALLCTITGNAPDQASDLQLMLAVSDGAATLNLVSLLEVAPRDGGLVFFDGFETPVCP